MNKVLLCGRLGKDPELKYTTSGKAVCSFSMATSEFFKNKNTGQKEEKTEWHQVVCWGNTAEYASNYLKKGQQLVIEGKLATRTWEDKDGGKRYNTEVICSHIENLGRSEGAENKAPDTPGDGFKSDDIPF